MLAEPIRPPLINSTTSQYKQYFAYRSHSPLDPYRDKAPQTPSLGEVVLWIAKLGGYLNRKHDPPPGPTVMWRGFLTLHEITEMYRIFRQNE